ncbi:condensin subunit Smc [Labedella gwakjiensis]|uniref:Chromosome partition protein Smc n=1 Tax=Labedella gwakjiensis TaxID=390269 RepID=A0A2P8H0Q7_9MICO|nr:chromosome segregation protein SMC [Labedella gwakjiensis]PSL39791.1 condensin subunit Smc [Labedella gwakjiensis]RUQ85829.1 chromosome segregation protein SMC [Labedella gwakjiensis]
MYLKSLTLKGFKSFASPTTFAFEQGVTCVVGPNGSGKSNVVDALAWVMGEQGAKTLRGGKMEDVIFAGTSTRGPLGRAEVTLTIDNSDGALPIEYTEVTISRTLFRNGGSEYAINGESCRLLDVQELLSDSGLGREMHVIVGQGQLDAVLRASPEERRGFIEEAAGILKHRRRKEKTVRKLEAMQTNLTRLSDLASEIRRQLKPLGRQAEVAREAQTIAAVVRDARARLLADEVVGLRRQLEDFSRNESERHTERIVLQEQLEQKTLRIARIEQEQQSDAVDGARRTSFALESIQERTRGLYTLATQKLALLGAEAEPTELTEGVTPEAVARAAALVVELQGGLAGAEAAWTAARTATSSARARLDAIDEEIAAQSALVSRHDLEITKLVGQADTAASRLAAVRGERLRQQNAIDQAEVRRDEAASTLARIDEESPLRDLGDSGLDEAYELAQGEVFEAEAEIDRLREQLHGHERERDALTAQVRALGRALEVKDGASDLIRASLPGIRGIVGDSVQVSSGFETAIAAALGSTAEAVLAEDIDAAVAAVTRATDDDLGRVEVVIGDAHAPSAAWPEVDGVTPASSVVTAPDGVMGLLAYVGVADGIAAARAAMPTLRAAMDGVPVTIVTRAGEVLTEHLLRGGSGGEQGRIELVAERDAAAERLTVVERTIDEERFELAEQRAAVSAAKERSQLALGALREYDAQLAAETEKVNRARVQAEASAAEFDRLVVAFDLSAEQLSAAESAADRAKAELETARSRPRPILDVSARDALSAEFEQAREREVEARLEVETARERIRAEQERVQALERRRAAERQAAEQAARRAVVRRRQMDTARRVVDALPAVLSSLDRSVAEARLVLSRAEADRSSQNEELGRLRREEQALRERLQAITESVHGLELQIYEKKLHLSGLLERAGSELGLVEDVLVAEYGPDVEIPVADAEPDENGNRPSVPFERQQQQRRFEQAERKLAQLGRVNPLALEEFAALEQRHTFLTEQLTDLTKTRADLVTIIEELDEKMQVIFEAAFEDTRTAFGEVFPVLFPGGTGSIRLTDPENLLTTGIEVSVKPAGKKIERLSLLSGGERSLAAVALLIAIFKARPSPFYIMDEVEAALDDANLGRLLAIFEDLRETSQLIVITHQKRTMEIADALYGVSMRQDGVSAVVGQRVVEERAS